jgi:hypothetical protein
MTDFFNGIGRSIGGLFDNATGAVAGAFSGLVHTVNGIVPGGFPIFVVLCAIGVLVGLATFRR